MTKYRILEDNGKFYPQFEEGNEWCPFISNTFTNVDFRTLEEAKTFLDYQSEFKSKQIIHEYNPQEDDKV
jgi:hypothetical protein